MPIMIRSSLRVFVVLALGWVPASGDDTIPRPSTPGPTPSGAHWANLNGPWQFRFDPKDEGAQAPAGPSPTPPGSTGRSPSRSPGRASCRASTRPKDRERRLVSPDVRASPPTSPRTAASGSASRPSTGGPTSGSTASRSPSTRGATRRSRPTSPTPIKPRQARRRRRPRVRPDRPEPADRQAGRLVHADLGHLADGLAGVAAEGVHRAIRGQDRRIDPASATVEVDACGCPGGGRYTLSVRSDDPTVMRRTADGRSLHDRGEIALGGRASSLDARPVRDPKLWTPETPHLYDVTLELKGPDGKVDSVKTYFGLRTIARGKYGDAPLRAHPPQRQADLPPRRRSTSRSTRRGSTRPPTTTSSRRDLRSPSTLGLNGLRIHIKPDEPRRLYWADKLGLLILEDMPNTWRAERPGPATAWEATMREVVARDRNHPRIVAWVAFNETWGLGTPAAIQGRQGHAGAGSSGWSARSASSTRPGSSRTTRRATTTTSRTPTSIAGTSTSTTTTGRSGTSPRSSRRPSPAAAFNYCPGQKQGTAPLINSEYGGVSAGGGDRDVSWGFRDLTTLLRRQPKIQGYVYTELTDIEWEHNGFVNYDRTPKHVRLRRVRART